MRFRTACFGARFHVDEQDGHYHIDIHSYDDQIQVGVEGKAASELPAGSIFTSMQEASSFFESGSVGYSPAYLPGSFDGLELRTFAWKMQPLLLTRVASSFFDDLGRFPAGSVQLDSALLMRGIEHEWHERTTLRCVTPPSGTCQITALASFAPSL